MKRRHFLLEAMRLPLALPFLNALQTHAAGTCADPDELSSSEQGLRKSLEYTDASADPAKVCATCAFFTPESQGPCGTCQILGGMTNARGHCTSWTRRS
jgi:High potential iron-sulfur protein